MKPFVLVLCLLPLAFSLELTEKSYKVCDHLTSSQVQSVSLEPCTQEPCSIATGSTVNIIGKFISGYDTNSDCHLKASFLYSGGWFEILNNPACGSSLECPLQSGKPYSMSTSLKVEHLPKGSQQTRWKLLCNSDADEIFCVDVTVNIQ